MRGEIVEAFWPLQLEQSADTILVSLDVWISLEFNGNITLN